MQLSITGCTSLWWHWWHYWSLLSTAPPQQQTHVMAAVGIWVPFKLACQCFCQVSEYFTMYFSCYSPISHNIKEAHSNIFLRSQHRTQMPMGSSYILYSTISYIICAFIVVISTNLFRIFYICDHFFRSKMADIYRMYLYTLFNEKPSICSTKGESLQLFQYFQWLFMIFHGLRYFRCVFASFIPPGTHDDT